MLQRPHLLWLLAQAALVWLLISNPAWSAAQLIGNPLTLETSSWQNAVCAHSGTSGTYLVVWIENNSDLLAQGNLVAQRVNASSGALICSQLVLDGTARAIRQVVGWCRLNNRFLVV